MKKQFFRMASYCLNAGKFVITVCIVVAGFTTSAQTTQVKQEVKVAPVPASVKYTGSQDDYMSFVVKYDNLTGEKFDVLVKDHDGSVLYKNVFTEKVFHKTFVLPKSAAGTFTFVIRDLKTNKVHSFEANTKLVEEMVVKRVG
jgi:hypothetical protein